MRLVASILVGLVLAAGLFVAGLAGLHTVKGPATETGTGGQVTRPPPFRIDPTPIDRKRQRIDFGPTEANHRALARIAGTLGPDSAGLRVLLVAPSKSGPILRVTTPDGDGGFAFSDVPHGSYQIRVQSRTGAAARPRASVTVRADLDVDLQSYVQQYELRVTVADAAGRQRPLEKATVLLARGSAVFAAGETDDGGVVLLEAARGAATWRVWASGPDWPGGAEWSGEITLDADPGPLRIALPRK